MDVTGRLFRHLDRCNNAILPGGRLVLRLGPAPIGFVDPLLAAWAAARDLLGIAGAEAIVSDQAALDRLSRAIADAGRARWRDEPFDVRASPDGPVLATADRGVLPDLGIAAVGVHLNGLVERGDGTFLWVARRAAGKLLDPGLLDHLAAGGVGAGMGPDETMRKEAAEECGLRGALADAIRPVGTIRYAMARPEGLRRDTLRLYDAVLPPEWVPEAVDGEVESFELWPLGRALEAVRDGEAFKFNVNLVLIDLFLRRGLIRSDALRSRLQGDGADPAPP